MELDYNTVRCAIEGDRNAQIKLLKHYDGYINVLSTVIEVKPDGTERCYVDEDMKAEIQTKYLEARPKCKMIK